MVFIRVCLINHEMLLFSKKNCRLNDIYRRYFIHTKYSKITLRIAQYFGSLKIY